MQYTFAAFFTPPYICEVIKEAGQDFDSFSILIFIIGTELGHFEMIACLILVTDLEMSRKWRQRAGSWHRTERLLKDTLARYWSFKHLEKARVKTAAGSLKKHGCI